MRTLVLIEPQAQSLSRAGRSLIQCAFHLGDDVSALVLGPQYEALAQDVAKVSGIKQVYWANQPQLESLVAEVATDYVLALSEQFDAILAPSTTFGKNILPRVAAKLDVAQISDVVNVLSGDTFEHPIYAGNAIETVQVLDNKKLLTVRTTAFEPVAGEQPACTIIPMTQTFHFTGTQFKTLAEHRSERPDLTQASVVVSGGRGLQSAEKFKLIEQLADCLGAAVGASRAAVDAGFVPNEYQVGQTGKVVAPALYFAVGISGAVQHIAGMKDAKVIVAINKDPDAPIFQVATYGLVGDLFQIIPELIQKLS
jgi:electron transfer flavoprotein alpha subunit